MKNLFALLLFFISSFSFCQKKEGILRGFWNTSRPEKTWAITHPFVAIKAWHITKYVLAVTDSIQKDKQFDGDADGGQVDAFRHTYWMAKLAQNIHPRKAWKLSLAHEKTGWLLYKKGLIEENNIPDAAAKEMDLRNNKIGLELGKANKHISNTQLINIVKQKILSGEVWIIAKDKNRQPLDNEGRVLPKEEYWGKWENKRCVVKSNFL